MMPSIAPRRRACFGLGETTRPAWGRDAGRRPLAGTVVALPSSSANMRQLLGRPG
jgi:hypothetical protein